MKVIVVLGLVLGLSANTFQLSEVASSNHIQIDTGRIVGSTTQTAWTSQTIHQFLGIPYAEAPSGFRRFKAPVPKQKWWNVLNATQYGRRCPVSTHVDVAAMNRGEDIEDCLSLCVYTKNVSASLPVMFYIYGGGFYNGTYADHPPKYLMEKDIVLVVPQFRLGALGWLSTNTKEMPGNMGFMDVLTALRWVQRNIRSFGGDPTKVTIFGQSAGAAQTSLLTMSPKVEDGLFTKAIVISGSIYGHWATNSHPFNLAKKVCELTGNRLCQTKLQVQLSLSKVNVSNLIAATTSFQFNPTVGDFYNYLPVPPLELAKTYPRKYPVMTGFTAQDGSFDLAAVYDGINAKFNYDFTNVTGRQLIDELFLQDDMGDSPGNLRHFSKRLLFTKAQLESTDLDQMIPELIDLCGLTWIKAPVITYLENHAENNPYDLYVYSFDYEGANTRFGYEFGNWWYPFNGGAHHSDDNMYLWSTHRLNAKDTKMAQKMVDLWTSFAITGQPQADNVTIPKYDGVKGPVFHINEEITFTADVLDELVVTTNDPNRARFNRPNVPWGSRK